MNISGRFPKIYSVVAAQTVNPPIPAETQKREKNPYAVLSGSWGGKRGGPARAKKLTKARLVEIARMGASARWKKRDAAQAPADSETQQTKHPVNSPQPPPTAGWDVNLPDEPPPSP